MAKTDPILLEERAGGYAIRVFARPGAKRVPVSIVGPAGTLAMDELCIARAASRDQWLASQALNGADRDWCAQALARLAERLAEASAQQTPQPRKAPGEDLPPDQRETWAALVLDDARILDRLAGQLQLARYAGPAKVPQLIYLAMTSRILDRPINLYLRGAAGAGKNYAIRMMRTLFPERAYLRLHAMSPRALAYITEPFQHRTIILEEAAALGDDEVGISLLRSLIWDHELRYSTVIDGKPVDVVKEGPTGLITTGTGRLDDELLTRCWTVTVPDDAELTRAILRATGAIAADLAPTTIQPESWVAAQMVLQEEAPWDVAIPYAPALMELLPCQEVRVRRDGQTLLSLIRAHAILHHRHRETAVDGVLVSTIFDYEVVYDLVSDVFAASLTGGATAPVRETVERVRDLTVDGTTVSIHQLAASLGTSPATAWRRARIAIENRWLVNEETRRGHPARLKLGEPMPQAPGLPDPETVRRAYHAAREASGVPSIYGELT
jgi:hypothetical protein